MSRRIPGMFRRRDRHDDDTLTVTLPPHTLELLGRWLLNLEDPDLDNVPGAVRKLQRAGLVPVDMSTAAARVLLAVGIEHGRQRIRELGLGDN